MACSRNWHIAKVQQTTSILFSFCYLKFFLQWWLPSEQSLSSHTRENHKNTSNMWGIYPTLITQPSHFIDRKTEAGLTYVPVIRQMFNPGGQGEVKKNRRVSDLQEPRAEGRQKETHTVFIQSNGRQTERNPWTKVSGTKGRESQFQTPYSAEHFLLPKDCAALQGRGYVIAFRHP